MERLVPRRLAWCMTTTTILTGYARGLTVAAAITAGLTAGVYFAFSTFIVPALRKLSPGHSISAMNAINKAAPSSPLFMLVLFGTGLTCIWLAIVSLRHRDDPAAAWLFVGAALYLVSMLITIGYHVPHNDALMKAQPTPTTWQHFIGPWLAWNHLRTVTAAGGTASLVIALLKG